MDLAVIPVEKSLLVARYKIHRLDGPSGEAELDVTFSGRGRIRTNNHSYRAMHRLFGKRSLYLSSARTVVADADRKRWHSGSAIEVCLPGETIVMRNESLTSANQVLSSGEREIGSYTLANEGMQQAKLSVPDHWGLHIAAFLVWIELRGRYLIGG